MSTLTLWIYGKCVFSIIRNWHHTRNDRSLDHNLRASSTSSTKLKQCMGHCVPSGPGPQAVKVNESRQLVPCRSGWEVVTRHCIQISHLWTWVCERVGVGVVGEVTSLQQSIRAAFNNLSNEIIPDQIDGLSTFQRWREHSIVGGWIALWLPENENRLLLNLSISRGLYCCSKAIRCPFNVVSWYLNSIYRFQILQVVLWGISV